MRGGGAAAQLLLPASTVKRMQTNERGASCGKSWGSCVATAALHQEKEKDLPARKLTTPRRGGEERGAANEDDEQEAEERTLEL